MSCVVWCGVTVRRCGVVVSWCRGVVVSWCRGVVVSWWRGVVVSWCRGVVVSWLLLLLLLCVSVLACCAGRESESEEVSSVSERVGWVGGWVGGDSFLL